MSTQYDTIGTTYDKIQDLPILRLQTINLHSHLAPYIKDAKILDLACGTGHYSRKFIEWGAKSVVGVDISTTMINAAQADPTHAEQLTFRLGDCSIPVRYDGGPFDVVVGAWLLNYARDEEEMTNMFRNIALNLKHGGIFIALTPYPTNDPRGYTERTIPANRPAQYSEPTTTVIKDFEHGVAIHLIATTAAGKVESDSFHLRKEVYERSAREGGMRGVLEWKPILSPGDGSEYRGSSWDAYLKVPHFGILVVEKSMMSRL